ncbi:hypothetical protein QN239_02525 [Mycolicibacterium sp. Y3]
MAHQRFCDAARRARGDAAGTRALIEVLLAHRSLSADALQAAMSTAVATGMCDPQVVIIEARRHSHGEDRGGGAALIGVWARYDRRPRPWPATTSCSPEAKGEP